MYELVALIVEVCEVDERGPMATGLFDCQVNWVGDGGEPPPDPPDDAPLVPVSLGEALAWGRVHADRVAVRIACEVPYSAGRVALPEPPLDESRVLGRRRPAGWEFLARTDADAPISWDVIVEVDTPSAGRIATGGTLTALGARWHDALDRSGSFRVVEITSSGNDRCMPPRGARAWTMPATVPAAVLRGDARGYEEAIRRALRAASAAAAAVSWEPAPELSADRAFATGSRAAHTNGRLDANGVLF